MEFPITSPTGGGSRNPEQFLLDVKPSLYEGPPLSKNTRLTVRPGVASQYGMGSSMDGSFHGPDFGRLIGADMPAAQTSTDLQRGPVLHKKNIMNTQQVVDEANTDNFTTVMTKMKDMVSLLEKASDDDKTLVLFELQQVVEFDRNFVVKNILPVICKKASFWAESVQVPAAEALSTVLKSAIPPEMAKQVCKMACDVIISAKDESNRDLWGEVLARALPHGSWTALELDRVVQQLQSNTNSEKYPKTRKLTARILGSMAISSVDQETKKVVLDRAVAMTTDDDDEVRGIIADSMAFIGAALDVMDVESSQWPTLHRLSQDENACVRAACLRAISIIADAHKSKKPNAKLFRYLLPSLFYKECTKMRRFAAQDLRSIDEDSYLIVEINSEIFGKMLKSCYEFIPDDASKKEIYKAYLSMATCNSPVIRKNCAANLTESSTCFGEKCSAMLASLIEYLSHDSDEETRWTLAAHLHEAIPHMANKETIATIFKAVLVLLRDRNWIVRQNLMRHFQPVVAELSKHCTYNASGKMSSLFEQLQLLCEGNWRMQELLVKQLQLTAPLVPPTSMTGNVLPLLYRISREGTYLVRKAAMSSIATYIRFVPDSLDRDREMKKFCEEWAHGSVYWMRIGFIDAANMAVSLYSRCLFRDTFGLEVLKLAHDLVSNVRLRVAMLLPAIAPACYIMDEFQAALDNLKEDEVPDIREAALASEAEIEAKLHMAREKFEEDMKLEEEERELYSRHLQNQKEANKKKNNLKKAAGGWWNHKMGAFASRIEDLDSPVTPAKKSTTNFSKSSSSSRIFDTKHPDETQSAEWGRTEIEPIYSPSAIGNSKDDSDIFKTSRSLKGLRPFLPGKNTNTGAKKRNSIMIKK